MAPLQNIMALACFERLDLIFRAGIVPRYYHGGCIAEKCHPGKQGARFVAEDCKEGCKRHFNGLALSWSEFSTKQAGEG